MKGDRKSLRYHQGNQAATLCLGRKPLLSHTLSADMRAQGSNTGQLSHEKKQSRNLRVTTIHTLDHKEGFVNNRKNTSTMIRLLPPYTKKKVKGNIYIYIYFAMHIKRIYLKRKTLKKYIYGGGIPITMVYIYNIIMQ